MKKSFIVYSAMLIMAVFILNKMNIPSNSYDNLSVKSTSSPKSNIESKKGRWEYFHRMLKDPNTGEIPSNIRAKELDFAKKINQSLSKSNNTSSLTWQEAGPFDLGGRTRSVAIDVNNSNTIFAGSATGGIWKSIDNGESWELKNTSTDVLSVTSIAQDTRSGNTNTWYYASGELLGSGDDQGSTHSFSGAGIYKSTDSGESWSLLSNAKDTDPTRWNTQFDFVSKIIVNPSSGSVFIASHAFGIFRSTDGGGSFSLVIGGVNEHIFSDIDVTPNGTLVAVLSSPFSGITASNTPGVYKSTNDGTSWTSITPSTFPSSHMRSIINAANNSTAYVLTNTGNYVNNDYEDIRFHKINIADGSSLDRSSNLPEFSFSGDTERLNTQNSYNMTLAVKPDNENFVIIGGTSLFRSTDGFATKPTTQRTDWIGGYHPIAFFYPNLHPDIHSFAFDPNNSSAVWFGHDGGLSYTSNIANTSYNTYFPWENKNNAYNVTQFYMVAIPDDADDDRILGGTQDNGTPYFRFDGTTTTTSDDISSGDGSYGYFGDSYCYASVQNGTVIRLNYDSSNDPSSSSSWSNITPLNATNQLFINPYAIDPNDENTMMYPAGNVLWRNNQLNSLPTNTTYDQGISTGWSQLTNLSAPSTHVITALTFSVAQPTHRLYYGAVDFSGSNLTPKIYRLDNANSATSGAVDISIDELSSESFISNIAVNPENGNEVIVIVSNYSITGIYYSNDGGNSFTTIEGNLDNASGPSIRGASILPTVNGTEYFIGTSTGVYSTSELDGDNTVWTQEGENTIGNVIVNYIASRTSDGRIVAGTHGRGAFVTQASTSGTAVADVNVSTISLQSRPGSTGSSSFIISNTGTATLNYSISVSGTFGNNLPKTNKIDAVLDRSQLNSPELEKYRSKTNFSKANLTLKNFDNNYDDQTIKKTNGDDPIIHDDGSELPDTYVGWGTADAFDWYNVFTATDDDYQLDSFEFYVQTGNASSNEMYLAIYDNNAELIDEGTINFDLASDGAWFSVSLTPAISINQGENFYIELYSNSGIDFPAGTDYAAQIEDMSFYYNGSSWVNLNTISGFQSGAFLIRAYGTYGEIGSDYVTVEPSSGSISPGGSQTITLTLDAQNLSEGTYTGEVDISTNVGDITIPIDYLVDVDNNNIISNEFNLKQNYPNPFNPSTTIEYSVPSSINNSGSKVQLKIFDLLGREVTTLVNETQKAGSYKINFDASNFTSGIYLYQLTAGNKTESRKMILMK